MKKHWAAVSAIFLIFFSLTIQNTIAYEFSQADIVKLASKSKSKPEKKSTSKKSKNEAESEEPAEIAEELDLSRGTTLALPEKKAYSFFNSISPEALSELEKGSPQMIRMAVSKIKKNDGSYSEIEKIFLNTAAGIMQILWPSQAVTWDTPIVTEKNPYTGAIASCRQGVYDSSTGNTDFLTMTLPSMVLLASDTRSDYYEESHHALEEALKLRNDSVIANYLMGVLLAKQKKFGEALEYLEKTYHLSNDTVEIIYALTDCNLKYGKFREAFNLASAYLAVDPQNRKFLKICAETSFKLNDFTNAEQFVARVLQQEPDNTAFILFRAQILIEKNDYIKATSLLDVYSRTDTKSKDYLISRAKVQKDWNKNIGSAISTLETALELYPDDKDVILLAAKIISGTQNKISGFSSGDFAKKLLELNPDSTEALSIQISQMIQEKKWEDAYASSTKLLKFIDANPEDMQKHIEEINDHINICLNCGRNEEAFRLASQIYSQDNTNENTTRQYLRVLISANRFTEAGKIISELLPSANPRMKSFLYFERSYLTTNEDQILAELRSSLTANPRNQDSLFRLYEIYFSKKEFRKAQYYLRQVVALNPSDEDYQKLSVQLETLLNQR